jgi:hypothetical protein
VLARLKPYAQASWPWFKRALYLALALFLFLPLLVYALLRTGGLTPFANFFLGRSLAAKTPVQVRVGSLRSDGLHFLEADDVVVLAPLKGAKVPLLTIASLRLEFDAYDAWRGRVPKDEALQLARIRGMNIFVLRDREGRWNTSVLFGAKSKGSQDAAKRPVLPLLPAGRVELEDSQVVFNDEAKGFHSNIERLQGSLDTRALPLIAFSLVGRTEGLGRDNLSLAGESDLRDKSFDGRLDLAGVELKEYLNYFMPGQGLRFEAGEASLSVRLQGKEGQELVAVGRADLERGQLRIPGIADPLSAMTGRVAFDSSTLRFKALSARFLGSQWNAEGGLDDLRHPHFNVHLQNPAFGLQALSEQVKGLEPLALSGSAGVDVTLTGPAQRPLIQGLVTAPWVSLAGIELADARAKVQMLGPQLHVDSLKASVWDGSIDGSLSLGLGKGGKLQADMVFDGVRLELAKINGQRPLPLSGTAFVELKLRGLVKAPALEGRLEVHQAYLGVMPLGKVEADAHWAPGDWETQFQVLDGHIQGVVGAEGRPAVFKKTVLQFKGIDLGDLARGLASAPASRLLPASASHFAASLDDHFTGQTDAIVTVEGPLKMPTAWIDFKRLKGQLSFKEGAFQLANPKSPLELDGEGSIGFGVGDVLFGRPQQPFKLKFSHRGSVWQAQALGRFPLKAAGQPGKVELTLDSDLRLLDAFAFFSHSSGKLSFDGNVGGTLDAPVARGELKVDGFGTEPKNYLAPIKDGSLRAQLRDQVIELPQLRFRSGGQVSASGRLDLSEGLKAASGEISISTDQEGLRLQNWEAMGTANVILDPLRLTLNGENEPLGVNGRIKLFNAVIVYGGSKKKAEGEAPIKRGRGMSMDLRVGLGTNVWYEKQHDKTIDVRDLFHTAVDSAMETLERPDLYFRLRPTDQDFVIQGTTPDVQMHGELGISLGHMTLMENDFDVKPVRQDGKASHVRFVGNRAEVWAEATARMRYMREDPLTQRPQAKAVNVIVTIDPLPEDDLERSDLAHAFLNYHLSFDSDPRIIEGNTELQNAAILNLVVLGDPLVDQQGPGSQAAAGAQENKDNSAQLLSTQASRLFSGEVRKLAASLGKKFKFLGKGFIDVFRVVPRLKVGASRNVGSTTAAGASDQARDTPFTLSDITLEAGKSITDHTYGSLQAILFGESTVAGQAQSVGSSGRIVRDKGVRAGVEYQFSPNRTLEAFYSYSVDENLEPVAFDPNKLYEAHSGIVQLRNTLPTGTYSEKLARERRWGVALTPTETPKP